MHSLSAVKRFELRQDKDRSAAPTEFDKGGDAPMLHVIAPALKPPEPEPEPPSELEQKFRKYQKHADAH